MVTFKGTKVVSGIVIGKLFVYMHPDKHISRTTAPDTEAQLAAFHDARRKAIEQLEDLYDSTISFLGELNASIFVAQEMLLEDDQYISFVEKQIKESQYNAAYAIVLASDEFSRILASIEDKYMQSHVSDVMDVSERMLRILCGAEIEMKEPGEPCIFVSDDFNAGDIVQFDREKVLGLATMFGSPVSHASILAATMGLPSIVGLGQEMLSIYDGKLAMQTERAVWGIRVGAGLIPIIMCVIGFIPMLFFPIGRKLEKEISDFNVAAREGDKNELKES